MKQPEHCDHECVCPTYSMHGSPGFPCPHNQGNMGTTVTSECKHDTRTAAIAEHNKRPRPPCEECVYEHQRALKIHWRDLFISDLRGSLEWDANHGNPELFKAVKTLDDHYNKFTVDDHDNRVRKEERERVLDELRDLVRNAKKYGTIEPEELFHWTGIIAMIESLRGKP